MNNDNDDFIHSLFYKNEKKLFTIAYLQLKNYHAAEDIVQDVFVVLNEKKETVLAHPKPVAWLFVVLKYKLLHEYRARVRFRIAQEKLEQKLQVEQSSSSDFTSDIFDCLTERELNMLSMLYADGLTIRMIAEKLGIKYETCRRQVQRAKSKLLNGDY